MNTWADNEHPKTNRVNTSVKVRFMTEAFNPQQTYPACEAKTCRMTGWEISLTNWEVFPGMALKIAQNCIAT
jgi:hypothetical protein